MSDPSDANIQDLLREDRTFAPSADFVARARVVDEALYERAASDPEAYWEAEARELSWITPWDTVCEWTPPSVKWFVGAKTNITINCLDRHLEGPRRHKAALIFEGEPHDRRTYTYLQLHREVCQFANALKRLGVGKGDRVAIYLPMIPEALIALLACARIGAIHSVVFGGFSPDSLADRINDSACKLVITADGGWRRGAVLDLKAQADKAIVKTSSVEHVVVVRRAATPFDVHIEEGRDHWYHRLLADASPVCEPEPMDAEDVLFILYTSGTTGKPKGIVHTCGGYQVGAHTTMKYVFDARDEDVFWCTADVGWITGHTYVTYGPLMTGSTQVIYEGAPNHPEPDRFWEMVARHRVSVFYTAPTAIRAFMKWGEELPARHDLSSLRLLGSVGEPINPEAWTWYHKHIGGGRCPIVDTWWQTETGSIMISGLPGVAEMKPGFAGRPLPGIAVSVVNERGEPVPSGAGAGLLCIERPWPSMMRTIWGDHERFVDTYFTKWPGRPDLYFPGDGAKLDAEGRYMILGRIDDVLNVSGHRIGTMEVESALVEHPVVCEAAVVGRAHDLKGQAIVGFVSLHKGHDWSESLRDDLRQFVAEKIGSLARPDDLYHAPDLPKTRSGKIMRRLLRDIAAGRALGDTTTLADPTVLAQLRDQYQADS